MSQIRCRRRLLSSSLGRNKATLIPSHCRSYEKAIRAFEINDVCYPDRHQNSNLPDGWINSLPRTCLLIFWKRDFISSSNNQVGNKRGELLKHRPRFVCNRSSLRNLVDDWTCWKLCARVSTASVRHTAFNKRINQKTGHLILVSGNNSRWIPLSR